VSSSGPLWSTDVRQADWIADRLSPREDEYTITIVVPSGFEAYARVLHPVETPGNGDRLVRWADVAAWSGMPLRNDAEFHSVALPPTAPAGPPPYSGQGPRVGSLYLPEAEAIAAHARAWTATPEDCWFCVWDGFGWETSVSVSAFLTEDGEPPEFVERRIPDPVPAPVRNGPRVRLPHRDYLLYQGPAEDVTAPARLAGTWDQCANLWWPADHAWCVASEIDLPWTYVGGPRGLIDAIFADPGIEALPASPGDPVGRVEEWVTAWVDELADGLLARGEASLTTPRGSIQAWLRRPGAMRGGELRIEATGARDGYGSSGSHRLQGDDELRIDLTFYLTFAVTQLAEM
jgi:hypothetical protein